MAHVDPGLSVERGDQARRRGEKRAVIRSKVLEHLPQRGVVDRCLRGQLIERKPPARDSTVIKLGERAKYPGDERLPAGQFLCQDLVRVLREGTVDAMDGLVVRKRDVAAGLLTSLILWRCVPRSRLLPEPQKTVLQYRQLIQLIPAVVEKLLDQHRFNRPACQADRPGYDLLPLIARERRNEELRCAYRFGETLKARTVANEVRAHRQDHADLDRRASARFEQQLDEMRGLVARRRTSSLKPYAPPVPKALSASPKQLFELVDQQDD